MLPAPKLPVATSHCKLLIWEMPRESHGRVSTEEPLLLLVPVLPKTAPHSIRADPRLDSPDPTTPQEEGQGDGMALWRRIALSGLL